MGAIIHYLEMPAFIVTLAGMFLARGMAFVLSINSIPIKHPFYGTMKSFYYRLPGGGRITLDRRIDASGLCDRHPHCPSHPLRHQRLCARRRCADGAALMGVPVGRTTILIYALSGFLAGLSGIVFSLYTSAGYSLAAVGVELDAIAAVVIGGTLLTGGAGFVARNLDRRPDPGADPDLHHLRWHAVELVDEDSDRPALLFAFILMQKGILFVSRQNKRYA